MTAKPRRAGRNAALVLLALPALATADTLDLARPEVQAFVQRMEHTHGISPAEVRALLERVELQPAIIELITRPAEKAKPWHEYRRIFVTPERVAAGVEFWSAHREALDAVAADTGVPPEIVLGILGVETYFGRITGRYRVLDALATLGFDYPPRARFFAGELEQFILLAREQGVDVAAATGSYAGAMGSPQFIPSSYRAYAVDGNADGRVDLWTQWEDVFASVANYFTRHGWQPGGPVAARVEGPVPEGLISDGLALDRDAARLAAAGLAFDGPAEPGTEAMLFVLEGEDGPEHWIGYRNFHVITRYNRSNMYALAVHQLGQAVAEAGRADE